jgi:uncharacterized protein (TIRG00374 family)
MRRFFRTARVVFGVGIMAYLLWRSELPEVGAAVARSAHHPGWLTAGLLLTFAGLNFGVLRWREILRTQGFHLSTLQVFRIFFIGQFFNAFMPGACGGDVARAYYAVRSTARRRTEAASTVFVDRAIGLFTTVVFGSAMILWRLPFFLLNRQTKEAGLLMLGFLAGAVIGLLVLFRRNLFERWNIFRDLETRTRMGPWIRRAYDAFYLYRSHGRILAIAGALSLLNLVFLTLACLCFGRSLELELPAVDYFMLFPIITTLAAVPLTPGALGIREGLFIAMFGWVGVDDSQAILMSLMVYASGLLCSLLGGVFFIREIPEAREIMQKDMAPDAESPAPPVRSDQGMVD